MLFSRSFVLGFGLSVLLLGVSLPTPTLAAHLRRNDYNASAALTLTNNSTIIVNARLHAKYNTNNSTHRKAPLANQEDKTGGLEWAGQAQATAAPAYSGVSVSAPMGDQGAGLTDQVPGTMPFGTGIVNIPIKDEVVAAASDEAH